ncbi:hypothetical protein NX059_001309 [Plenodomus lindquistii]|nr:hypothetical protein NX059_001309 [Plenodomus lindquistii]
MQSVLKLQSYQKATSPNASFPFYTTASEVATMDFIRSRLQIPVPKVLSYSTKANANTVGAEYIIVEKSPGIELARVWDRLSGRDKVKIVIQMATFSARLSQARFPYYGSVYYSKDIPEIKGTKVDDTFSQGPATGHSWFDNKREEVDVSRGPCEIFQTFVRLHRLTMFSSSGKSTEEVLAAILKGEAACLDTFADFPRDRQQGIYSGPGGFEPSKTRKKKVIEDFSRIMPFILPRDEGYTASVFWHTDLHLENILSTTTAPRRSLVLLIGNPSSYSWHS